MNRHEALNNYQPKTGGVVTDLHRTSDDEHGLAQFGYKQRLDRSLGAFSSFAVSYGWVAILVGVSSLFYFGFGAGGPAFFWVYPVVGAVQLLTGLCLAEMAGQVPVAGSMYQWSKNLTRSRFVPWFAGWTLAAAMLVTVTVEGPTLQIFLTTISPVFEIVGGHADLGTSITQNGAIDSIIYGVAAIAFVGVLNIVGVKAASKAANIVVFVELIAAFITLIGLLFHIKRGPGVVFHTFGTGANHIGGYAGAFLIAMVAGAYVFFGFENAATLAEETLEPRKVAPRAILQALLISIGMGILLVLLALLAVGNVHAPELATIGYPYVIFTQLGSVVGRIVLSGMAIAAIGACAAILATAVRSVFAMARDDALPFSKQLAHVSPRFRTPTVATGVVALLAVALLFVNFGNPSIFATLGSVSILLFYICYLFVTVPMLVARVRGDWPRSTHGGHFSLGRWGLPINVAAVLTSLVITIDVAWPRSAVYGNAHWYLQYGALLVVGLLVVTGVPYYLLRQRHKPSMVVEEHRVELVVTHGPAEPDADLPDSAVTA